MKHSREARVIAGKYRLVRPISKGGMGSVWLAAHLDLDVPVAVKFMRASLAEDADARARFAREAKAAALIPSPHVVRVYDHGIDEGAPYLVMEYLEGEDLGQRLKREGPLPVVEVVRICAQICKGLRPAHELGIVHRDLKPGNVFLCSTAEGACKLLDFGIAKETGIKRIVESEATTTGQLLGSPQYVSPEQARGLPVDSRSDLWSVAVVLFRVLTGRRPFEAHDMGDLIVRICMDPIPSVSALRPELDPALDAFFERALSREVDERYPDCEQFFQAFATAALGPSSQTHPMTLASEPPGAAPSWDSAVARGASPVQVRPAGDSLDDTTTDDMTTREMPSSRPVADAAPPPSGNADGALGATLRAHRAADSRRRVRKTMGLVALVALVVAVWVAGTQLGWSPFGASHSELPGSPSAATTAGRVAAEPPATTPLAAGGAATGPDDASGGSTAGPAASPAVPAPDAGVPAVRRPPVGPRPAKPPVSSKTKEPLPDIGY